MTRKEKEKTPVSPAVHAVFSDELRRYREALEKISPAIKAHAQRLFQAYPRTLGRPELLDILAELYSYARHDDRHGMIDVSRAQLLALGEKADHDPKAPEDAILQGIGEAFPTLVLEGTLQQQLCARFSVHLGLVGDVPESIRTHIVTPMIDALITVLRVGAPTTRDSAVEGLGALLQLMPDPEKRFPPEEPIASGEEQDPDPQVRALYFERFERRRLMVLAVACHQPSRIEFFRKLREPLGAVIARIRADCDDGIVADELQRALYERSDLLRTLPAMCRQAPETTFPEAPTELLRDAARLPPMREDDPVPVLVAYARFQESVFRTMEVMIKRTTPDVDEAVAEAIGAIPRTLVGAPLLCNAQVRATVAMLRTAIRLLGSDVESPRTAAALRPLFDSVYEQLEEPSAWLNPGIAEGCFAGLPMLLQQEKYNKLTRKALNALFTHLHKPHDFDDFVETHRQLIAYACFRRILVLMMEQPNPGMEGELRELLRWPDTEHVLAVLQGKREPSNASLQAKSRGVAEVLISGMSFESELLKRSALIFKRWEKFPPVKKFLLTRILAAQLRASSQDAREIARYTLLGRLYATLPTVSLTEPERLGYVWDLLSALPAESAGAADPDLQDFVDHCGRRNRGSSRKGHHVEDLPGHVLAMITDKPTTRIADAIAREIDLNRRHEQETNKEQFDFATSLYQVMLRGPDETIFDHLLPRIREQADRRIVLLFRKHVGNVQHNPKLKGDQFDINHLLANIDRLLIDLKRTSSPTLIRLATALELYRQVAVDEPGVWKALADGGLEKLFETLDSMAAETRDTAETAASLRKPLAEQLSESVARLKRDVSHYRDLPVGEFEARATALNHGRRIARQLEAALKRHVGLQPPERIMLIALMQHLRDLFDRTNFWFCEEPQRKKKAGHHVMFWILFACEPKERDELAKSQVALRLAAAMTLSEGSREEALEQQTAEPTEKIEMDNLRLSAGPEPPQYEGQRDRFERYFVDWMSSELRVDVLRLQLRERWPRTFRWVYGVMTSPLKIAGVVLVPSFFAVLLHQLSMHTFEGIVFFILASLVVVGALLSFSLFGSRAIRRKKAAAFTPAAPKPKYRLQSVLPRLARLIAVPMALIVELDHSYEFSLYASTWVLILLMALAFLTTRFFINRELIDPDKPHAAEPSHGARVRPVVAVALSHSFGIATLFAIIFASSHVGGLPRHAHPTQAHVEQTGGSRFWRAVDRLYQHIDGVPKGHEFPSFAGLLPRDVVFDLGEVLHRCGAALPPALASHLRFVFYPTIILTWTALGLFVGVFLEGFVKGERLSGVKEGSE